MSILVLYLLFFCKILADLWYFTS